MAAGSPADSESGSRRGRFKGPYARRRCLVPATQYFEWTTDPAKSKGRKLMWRFNIPGHSTFAMAGLCERAHLTDGPVESFVFLTSAPGTEQSPYHNRRPVILERIQWATWLDLSADPAPCMRGLEDVIAVERATAASLGA